MENEFGRTILFHKKHLKNYIWIVHYLIKMESKVMVEVVCTQDTLRVKRLFLDEIKTIKNQLAEQGIKKLKATKNSNEGIWNDKVSKVNILNKWQSSNLYIIIVLY